MKSVEAPPFTIVAVVYSHKFVEVEVKTENSYGIDSVRSYVRNQIMTATSPFVSKSSLSVHSTMVRDGFNYIRLRLDEKEEVYCLFLKALGVEPRLPGAPVNNALLALSNRSSKS